LTSLHLSEGLWLVQIRLTIGDRMDGVAGFDDRVDAQSSFSWRSLPVVRPLRD
jgi:hypothetical protein